MKTLDLEAIYTTLAFFFMVVFCLMLLNGESFHKETTAYYKIWSESMSPLSFNFLGVFSLFSGGVFYWANPEATNSSNRWFRRLYVHPLNATFTTGAAGAGTIYCLAFGFLIYHHRFDYAAVCFLIASHILLILWGLAKLDEVFKNSAVQNQQKKWIGFAVVHLVIVVSLFYVVKYSAQWL